jgi:hypothetical protein
LAGARTSIEGTRFSVKGVEAMARAAATTAARIAELEDQVGDLQRRLQSLNEVASRRGAGDSDPGDTVPSGLAVVDPEHLDEQSAWIMRPNNEPEHLAGKVRIEMLWPRRNRRLNG